MHEFGRRVLQVKVGKNKNELLPLSSFHSIKTASLPRIKNSIDQLRELYSPWIGETRNAASPPLSNDNGKIDCTTEATDNKMTSSPSEAPLDIETESQNVRIKKKEINEHRQEIDDNEKIMSVVSECADSALSDKINNDNKKVAEDHKDDRSAISQYSHSEIHIRERKGTEDRIEKNHQSLNSLDRHERLEHSIEELSLPSLAKDDDRLVRLGLQLFYSVLVVTFYGDYQFMSDACVTASIKSSNKTPTRTPIPVEAVYWLWIAVLDKEGHMLDIIFEQVIHSLKAAASGINRESYDHHMFTSLDSNDGFICNCILKLLCEDMLICSKMNNTENDDGDPSCNHVL